MHLSDSKHHEFENILMPEHYNLVGLVVTGKGQNALNTPTEVKHSLVRHTPMPLQK